MSVSNTQKKNSRGREGREKEIEHRGEKVKFMCWWQRDEEEDEGEMWLTKKKKKRKRTEIEELIFVQKWLMTGTISWMALILSDVL